MPFTSFCTAVKHRTFSPSPTNYPMALDAGRGSVHHITSDREQLQQILANSLGQQRKKMLNFGGFGGAIDCVPCPPKVRLMSLSSAHSRAAARPRLRGALSILNFTASVGAGFVHTSIQATRRSVLRHRPKFPIAASGTPRAGTLFCDFSPVVDADRGAPLSYPFPTTLRGRRRDGHLGA